MGIVRRYLGKGIGVRLSIALPAVVLIYLAFELADSGRRSAATLGWATVLKASLLHAPLVAVQVLPIALLLSTVLWIGWLRRRGELLAIAACGRSPRWLLLRPLLGAGALATIGAIGVGEWVAPWCEQRADVLLRHRPSLLTGSQQAKPWIRSGDWFFHHDRGSKELLAFRIRRATEKKRRHAAIIERIEGRWTKGTTVTNVQRLLFDADGFYRRWSARLELPALETAGRLFAPFKAESHGFAALDQQLRLRRAAGQRWRAERMMLHAKLAYPFINLILTVAVGVLLPLSSRRRPIVADLATSLAALLGLWVLLAGGWLAGRTGLAPVVVAAWGPGVLAAIGVVFLAWRGRIADG